MKKTTQQPSSFLQGIDKLIEVTTEQLHTLEGQPALRERGSAEAMAMNSEDWELFLSRLQQIKDTLRQDRRLLPVVDDFIGRQVRKMEHRQWWSNGILTVIGAILGWLVSAFGSPWAFWRLMGH